MTSRICKYGCGVLLEGWDDNAKKYIEAGTGGLHTKERCQEAKAKLAQKVGPAPTTEYLEKTYPKEKDDHGNEETLQGFPIPTKTEYVDHTSASKGTLKIKTLVDPTPEGFDIKYNTFAENHKIQFSQYQLAPSLYTMVVWYSEEGKA